MVDAPENQSDKHTQKPLHGIRVLEVSSGPMAAAGRQLAELGACVTAISTPRERGQLTQAINHLGKQIIELDTSTPEAESEILDRLPSVDILILDTSETTSIDPMALHADYPDLVILALSPFGLTGSCRDWQVTEPVMHALSGELSRSGIPDREPLIPPDGLGYGCSAAQASYVTLLAYWTKLRTGNGALIDFSIFEGAAQVMDPGFGVAGSASAGVPADKMPWGRPEARQRYPIIRCKDGFVRICVLAKRQWHGMFEWMGSPEAFADPSYYLLHIRFNDPELIPAITEFFSDKTAYDLEVEGQKRGVPTAVLYKFEDAIQSEQMTARDMFIPRELMPGVTALTPNGALSINGRRMAADEESKTSGSAPTSFECNLPSSHHPMEGLTILDLGVIVVGAESGRLFGDQGANVIKVENSAFPDGIRQSKGNDVISITFATGNRNKKGLGLNLRTKQGVNLFRELAAKTDIILANFKSGTMESLGLDYDTLSQDNPGLIMVDSSAFGPTGPWASRLGYGPLVRASAGIADLWRYEGEDEGFSDALTVYPDHVASRVGVCGVIALLIQRLGTGKGGLVSISQAEVAMNHLGEQAARADLARRGLTAGPAESQDAPWGVFPCRGDDDWCVITVRGDKDWSALCDVMGRPGLAGFEEYASAASRFANRGAIRSIVTEWLSGLGAMEATRLLQANGVPAGAMLRVTELPEFEAFKDRDFFIAADHPHIPDPVVMENAPSKISSVPDPLMNPAPLMGEHSREVVRDILGLDPSEIEGLTAKGVLEVSNI